MESLMTYRNVGESVDLPKKTLDRYVEYMTIRWLPEQELQCRTGYALEWAYRFKYGDEYSASDYVGKGVLKAIYEGGDLHDKEE